MNRRVLSRLAVAALFTLLNLSLISVANAAAKHPAFSEETLTQYDALEAENKSLREDTEDAETASLAAQKALLARYAENIRAWGRLYDRAGGELREYSKRFGPQSQCVRRSEALNENRPPYEEMESKVRNREMGDSEPERGMALFIVRMIAVRAWTEGAEPWYVASLCTESGAVTRG